MEPYSIFIVEDDPWYGEVLSFHLSLNPEFTVKRLSTAKECLASLQLRPSVITIDYRLPDMNGFELFKKIRTVCPDLPVIIISSQDDVSIAVEFLKAGASEYFVKDDNTRDLLWNAIIRIRENQQLRKEVDHLREQLGQQYEFGKIIKGSSTGIQKLFALMEKAAKTNINVSVTGETGTGKELVAKAIHYNSDRKKKPFIAVNMAAIPSELIESELFGHEKGAFTGAIARKPGKFEEANGGTLFLDEIAELSLSLQSKLLRALQEREIVRVGGNELVKLDVRVITATHFNLAEAVKKNEFREDLYYRLMGLPIGLPPLRERGNDILLLARFFLEEFCRSNKLPVPVLTTAAKEKLMKYNFPGNVRELKAIMDLAAVLSSGQEIVEDDISFHGTKGEDSFLAQDKTLKEYIADIVQFFMRKNNNNVYKVAAQLDIGKSTIYKMIQQKEVEL